MKNTFLISTALFLMVLLLFVVSYNTWNTTLKKKNIELGDKLNKYLFYDDLVAGDELQGMNNIYGYIALLKKGVSEYDNENIKEIAPSIKKLLSDEFVPKHISEVAQLLHNSKSKSNTFSDMEIYFGTGEMIQIMNDLEKGVDVQERLTNLSNSVEINNILQQVVDELATAYGVSLIEN